MTRTSAPHDPVLELSLLQLLRLKGRGKPVDLATSLGLAEETCTELLDAAADAGHCLAAGAGVRLTPEGRAHLKELADAERANVDLARLGGLYEEFCTHNTSFKAIITSWQMRDADVVNDHSDAAYDAEVLAGLRSLHEAFVDVLAGIVDTAPRLAHYPSRFATAIEHVVAGDHTYVARPIMDSYHTVWFELHEELICLLGLTREAEAAAGRAV